MCLIICDFLSRHFNYRLICHGSVGSPAMLVIIIFTTQRRNIDQKTTCERNNTNYERIVLQVESWKKGQNGSSRTKAKNNFRVSISDVSFLLTLGTLRAMGTAGRHWFLRVKQLVDSKKEIAGNIVEIGHEIKQCQSQSLSQLHRECPNITSQFFGVFCPSSPHIFSKGLENSFALNNWCHKVLDPTPNHWLRCDVICVP